MLAMAGVLAVPTTSCSDWLDVKMSDKIMENALFSTNNGFMTALNGVYMGMIDVYGDDLSVGIIDVMSLYGASAVKDSSQVQLAVYLENYDTHKTFDRLGNNAEEIEISGVAIPRIRIPVKTGRNISVVIEAAAMNYRAKQMGFDATKTFEERLTNLISKNGED